MRLKDLVSPALTRINTAYSATVQGLDRGASRIQSSFSRAAQSAEQLRRRLTFGSQIQSIDVLNAKLDSLTKRRNISVDTSEIRRLNREIGQAEHELQRLQNMGTSTRTAAAGGGWVSGMVSAAMPALGAAAILAGTMAFAKSGIDREQTQIAYEQFTRDPAVAKKLLADQNRFADVTPFTNDEVMGAGRNMLSYGFKANEIVAQESKVGDVAAGVQTNFGELAGIYGKLKSKGFADTKRRSWLARRGARSKRFMVSDIWQFLVFPKKGFLFQRPAIAKVSTGVDSDVPRPIDLLTANSGWNANRTIF